jgi:hypothetical protein
VVQLPPCPGGYANLATTVVEPHWVSLIVGGRAFFSLTFHSVRVVHLSLALSSMAVAVLLLGSLTPMALGRSTTAMDGLARRSATPLDVNFTATADGSCTGGPVTVPFHSVVSGGTPPYNYTWNFGDGSAPSYGSTANHTYQDSFGGPFNATLTVKDAAGLTGSHTRPVQFLYPPCATQAQQPSPVIWLVLLPFVAIAIVLIVIVRRRGSRRP